MANNHEMISAEGVLKCMQTSMSSVEYIWTLENFEPLTSGRNIRRSPAFCPLLNVPAQFYFQIECQKEPVHVADDHCISNIFYYLDLKSVGIIPVKRKVLFETKMIRDIGNDKFCESIDHELRVIDFLHRSLKMLFFKEKRRSSFVPDSAKNMVCIKSQMQFLDGPILSPMEADNLISFDCACYTKNLAQDLERIVDNSFLSDVTVKVGQTMFKAHKAILAARSPVFKMMIQHDCLESKTGIINVREFDSEIFAPFLKYLYTGDLKHENLENVLNLYEMADMYDVQSLRNSCFDLVAFKLSSGNVKQNVFFVCKVLKLAQRHSDHKLKELAIQFIVTHFKEVVAKKEWHDFVLNDFSLATEIFCHLTSTYKSIDIVKPISM